MDPEQTPSATAALIYLSVVVGLGLYVISRERKAQTNTTPGLGIWPISRLDFILLLWFIFMLVIYAPGKLAKFFQVENMDMGLWAILQFTPILLAYLGLILFTKILGNLNSQSISPLKAIGKGVCYSLSRYPVIALVGYLWANLIIWLGSMGLPVSYENQPYVDASLKSTSDIDWIIMAIGPVLLAPICEELTFRAVFYRYLRKCTSKNWAVVISTTLFAIVHPFPQFLPIFILGLFLAYAYERSGHILVPIAFHAFFNLNTFILLYLITHG